MAAVESNSKLEIILTLIIDGKKKYSWLLLWYFVSLLVFHGLAISILQQCIHILVLQELVCLSVCLLVQKVTYEAALDK